MDILNAIGTVLFTSAATILKDAVVEAVSKRADLRGANLRGANLRGANLYAADLRGADLRGKKIQALRVFTGLYEYQVWSILFADGTRWVKMGCLFYDLTEWEKIGVRESNLSEFPNDGSSKCEERVAAFEFAKGVAERFVFVEEKVEAPTNSEAP